MNPTLVRRVLIPTHERLLGRRTPTVLRELEESQWWSHHRLRELQTIKLRRLLAHAAERCPFHRERIEAAGIDPASAELDDLAQMPPLTKDDIHAHGADMLESPPRHRPIPYSTGGSTGEPLRFWIDRSRQAADQAARARTRRWFGVEPGERELYLWGAPVELTTQDRLRRMRDRLTNHLLLSAFNLTPGRMSSYLDRIRRFDPVHLFGYPSSLACLARHAAETGRTLAAPALRAVFVTGEMLAAADRRLIADVTRVPVVDGYGAREAGFIAHECPHGRFHVTMESLIVELLGDDGRPAAGDAIGEITVTHLDAFVMPFIRYRTGDLARRGVGACPCGRGLETLEAITGRRTDALRTVEGGHAHALSVIYVLREEPAVRQFRVEQAENLDLDVQLVATKGMDSATRERIAAGLRRCIGGETAVRLHLVDAIAAEGSGKHRCVVSRAR